MKLHALDDPEAAVLSRYAATIQLQRQDFNGRLLTIRRDDLRVLAAVLGRRPDDLGVRLDELGLRAGDDLCVANARCRIAAPRR